MLKNLFKVILSIVYWIKKNISKKKNKLEKSIVDNDYLSFDKHVFDVLISFISKSEYYHLILAYKFEVENSTSYQNRIDILDILFGAIISDELCFQCEVNQNIRENFIYFLKILRSIPSTKVSQLDEDAYKKVFSSFQQLS